MSHARRVAAVFAVLVGLCLLGACGGAPAVPEETSVPPGSEVTQAPEVPSGLECDPQQLGFPLPSGVTECMHLDPITDFRTNLSVDQVIQFYAEQLGQNGWTRKDDGALPGLGSWIRETKQLNVIAVVENNLTSVQIQLMNQ